MTQSKEVTEELFECYTKTAENIIIHFQEREQIIDDLKDVVQKKCELDTKLNMIREIKDEILEKYDNKITDKNIPKIMKDYDKAVSKMNVDVSTNERFLEFNRKLQALLTDANKNQNIEEDNSDEELQLQTDSMNVIDPISKVRIKDPVKNIACGHTYDRQNIMALLKVNKKTRCPMVGCKSTKYVEIKNLQTDVAMKVFLQRNPI
ncbi:PREDICTED: E3 SUMO-protein ligase NSE2-like [Polistes dominula]|uniref:E3 SUMO-protein ligase NSE2 n=1 Tax=Polistes dominula TaxID=743375 RepID=A0ABM1IWZ0_POLDO|nr:PREDICTED: E3 SUMO-protein ligase NSE2-like [Polistes dominula]